MKTQLIFILSLLVLVINAQDDAKNIFNKLNDENGGNVRVYQSPQLRLAMEKQFASINNKEGVKGYRIQIYFGNGKNARAKTNQARVNFISKYKDTKAHIVYTNPYFRLKVGDFRTKSEALFFLTEIKPYYPDAFIVSDIIDVSIK